MKLLTNLGRSLTFALLAGAKPAAAQPAAPAQPPPPVSPEQADKSAATITTTPPPTAQAKAPPFAPESDQWHFRLTPYFMLGAMNGNVNVKGHEAHVEQDLGDVLSLIKNHLNFGAAAHFEAEKGRWGIFTDAQYLDLTAELSPGNADGATGASFQQSIGELGGFYTIIPEKAAAEGFPTFRLDALVGARITWLEPEIQTESMGSFGKDKTWVDPIIGARAEVGFTDWLSARLRGDIGGFGIGSSFSSQFAWQVDAALSFHLSHTIDLDAGYRWLSQDYEDGEGADQFRYDITISGPYMGLSFRF